MTSPLHRSTPRASCAARPLSGETSTASAPALCATETVASSLPPGRAYIVNDTSELPLVFRRIFEQARLFDDEL